MSISSDRTLSYISTSQKMWDEIKKNDFSAGTQLMPIRKLAEKYNVSYVTAQKAVKILQDNGVLKAQKGRGIFVTGQEYPQDTTLGPDNDSGTKRIAMILPNWIQDQGKTAIYSIMSGFITVCQEMTWATETIFKSRHDMSWQECCAICDKGYDGIYWPSPSPFDIVSIVQMRNRGIEIVTSGRGFPQIGLNPVISNIQGVCKKIIDYSVTRGKTSFVVLAGSCEGSIITDSISQEFVRDFAEVIELEGITPDKYLVGNVLWSDDNEAELTELVLRKNPDVNSVICLSERVFPAIENLLNENFWDTDSLPLVFNCVGDYGYNPKAIGPIKLATIRRPYAEIGQVAAYHLQRCWTEDDSPELDLEVELVIPE